LVVVEDLDDLRLLDARHALRMLGVVHEQHAALLGIDAIRAGHQPNGPARPVHRDRGAVVDILDLLGDVGDQVVHPHRERLRVYQGAARRGERDQPGVDVAVQG
jgi:hypothetical protein